MAFLCAIVAIVDWLRVYSDDAFLSLATTVLGVLLGGLVNAYFARQGTKELRREAANLQKLNGLTIRILDEGGSLPPNARPTKDVAGNYTGGLTYSIEALAQGSSTAQADLGKDHNEPAAPDAQEPDEDDTSPPQG